MIYNNHVRNMMGGTTKIKTVEGVPPLTLSKSKGKAVKDYKIYGNSPQYDDTTDIIQHNLVRVSLAATYGDENIFSGSAASGSASWVAPCKPNRRYKVQITDTSKYGGTIWRVATVKNALPLGDASQIYTEPAIYLNRMTGYNEVIFNSGNDAHYLYVQSSNTYWNQINSVLKVTEMPPTPEDPIEIESVGEPILPSEYQEVEYIQSSGTQYIDTGVHPDNNTRVETKFFNDSMNSWYIFGSRLGINGVMEYAQSGSNSGATIFARVDNVTSSADWRRIAGGALYEVSLETKNTAYDYMIKDLTNNRNYSVNNVRYTALTNTQSLYIFALNTSNIQQDTTRFYYFKLSKSGTLVRDFIPCYRKSDNEIGMYDLVENKFYTNSGSGTFTKGNDKTTYKIPVMTNSRNLFDKNKVLSGYALDSATGELVSNSNFGVIEFGDLDKNTNYTISGFNIPNNQWTIRVLGYDTTYIGEIVNKVIRNIDTSPLTFNTGNSSTIKIQLGIVDRQDLNILQIEEGNIATSYVPYLNKTLNIYLNEPLRRIGTYADYIDFKNKKVVRNNGFIDMSKLSWSYNTVYLSSGLFIASPTNKLTGQTNIISEIYQTGPQFQSFSQMRNKAIAGYSSGSNRNVAVRDDDYNASTLDDFQNSLKGKYMCYPLETPTEESIELPQIPTAKGNCVIDIDTKIKPSNMLVKYIMR